MISTRSKAQFYNPHVEDAHLPDVMAIERDEVGLVRAICVKARSSSQRKELFKQVQLRHEVKILNLLLDMKVRWSSTYIMLHRAESRRTAINDFVYELGMRETNSEKRRKIAALQLTDEEWTRVTLFLNLLGVSLSFR
ncbi:hypothetical protein CPC08DRAFT_417880 [Agrocybe pediades]|nr:hypothetical protein CPC08DRAFT_417880 [Agrocybe pediades]